MGYIAGIGGANMDIHGRSDRQLIMRDSNPGSLHTSLGGVCRNICENLARLGENVRLITVVGDDVQGRGIVEGCEKAGIDMSAARVLRGERSSIYISIMDGDGDMLLAMSDMHIIKQLNAKLVDESRDLLCGADQTKTYAMVDIGQTMFAYTVFLTALKAAGGEKMTPQFIVKNMLTNKACIGMLLGIPAFHLTDAGASVAGIVIVAAVALLERLGFSTSTGRLLGTILAVTAVWLTAQGRVPEAPPLLRQWWQDYLPKNQDLAAFFLSMGVFSAAIQYSGFGDRLTELCAGHSGLLGPLVLPLLPLAIVAFSLVGLHPFVSVLMVGPILAGLPLPVTPLQLGLAMSLGCCLSYMLSPFAGLILTLSHELQEPPLRMCLRANLPFAIPYYLLATLAITWLC